MSQTKAQFIDGLNSSEFDNINVTGIITAASYSGDGSGLTGVANTAFINAEQVTVVGVVTATTFDGNLTGDVTGDVTGNLTGNVTGDVVGNITGVAATFSGNVSIGGTLTYEDVTNVDSIGVVTARTGVDVTTGGVDIAAGGLAVTGIATFNDNIVGDNSTNISGINSVTATAFYGDGSALTGIDAGGVVSGGAVSRVNDGANGRLDTFGGGNFAVYTSPGTFDTTGITSVRARVVGAGSAGCEILYTITKCMCGCLFGSTTCCYWTDFHCISGTGGGAGGGYAHKVFESPEYPGPGVFNVQVGQPWNCNCTPTVGTSCFGSTLCASGGIGNVGGSGCGGDFNATGGVPSLGVTGGAAGSQLGPGNTGTCSPFAPSTAGTEQTCGNITGIGYSSYDLCWGSCYGQRLHWGVERFPFDIFTGYAGETVHGGPNNCICEYRPGCSGGAGLGHGWAFLANSCGCAGCTAACFGCCICRFCVCPGAIGTCSVCIKSDTFGNSAFHLIGSASNGGSGAGGASGATYLRTSCNCYTTKSAGNGGFGGGGGAVISMCCSNIECSSCNCYYPAYSNPSGCSAVAGNGGPGIVIIEW